MVSDEEEKEAKINKLKKLMQDEQEIDSADDDGSKGVELQRELKRELNKELKRQGGPPTVSLNEEALVDEVPIDSESEDCIENPEEQRNPSSSSYENKQVDLLKKILGKADNEENEEVDPEIVIGKKRARSNKDAAKDTKKVKKKTDSTNSNSKKKKDKSKVKAEKKAKKKLRKSN